MYGLCHNSSKIGKAGEGEKERRRERENERRIKGDNEKTREGEKEKKDLVQLPVLILSEPLW